MGLYIAGAGGFGREALDVALELGIDVDAFLDDNLAGEVRRGVQVIRPDEAPPKGRFVVGIADPSVRRPLASSLAKAGLEAVTLVHPKATIAPDTTLGQGCVVFAGAYVSSSVRIGDHVQINYNATVGHDAQLADFSSVYPGANVSGAVLVEEDATIGSNACVLQGLRVGYGAFVGAGAVVTNDVAPRTVAIGVPAREHASSQDVRS